MAKTPNTRLAHLPGMPEAVARYGVERLAEMLSECCGTPISKQSFYDWERIPAERCLALYQILDGAVPLHVMRPDIYPDLAQWPTQGIESRSAENV